MYTASRKKDKTQHSVNSVLYSYLTATLHTSNWPKPFGDKKNRGKKQNKKNKTPRDMLAHDEKITGDFLIRRITQSRIGAYITLLEGKSHHKDQTYGTYSKAIL